MLVAISESGVVTLAVALLAFFGTVVTAWLARVTTKQQRQTRNDISDLSQTNTADHGTVAMALSALTAEVKDNHRRNGERFERIGERMGEIATRQEKLNDRVAEGLDHVNDRIDDVLTAQRDHIQRHLDDKT